MIQPTLYMTKYSPYVQDLDVNIINGGLDPVDLTDFTAEMYISKYFGSKDDYKIPISVFDPPNGILRINFSGTGTAQLPSGTMVYTIYLRELDGERFVLTSGTVVVQNAVPFSVPEEV